MRQLQGREFIAATQEPNRSSLEKYIHPGDQQHVTESIRGAVRTQSPFELKHRVLRIDGTLGWTFSRAIPLINSDDTVLEWFDMAGDVTARKQAQEALKDSTQKYCTLFESMDEGYCAIKMIFAADGQPADYWFLKTNPAFVKHTGLQNAQGKRMREIAPDHEAHWFEIYRRAAVTGEAIRFVNQAKELGGRWFDVYAFRFGDNGSYKFAVLFNGISDHKHAAEALLRSESRLRAVLEQAPLAVVFTGPLDDILYCNPMFDALRGRPARTYSEVYSGYHLDGRPVYRAAVGPDARRFGRGTQ